jgi:hypothetical protein
MNLNILVKETRSMVSKRNKEKKISSSRKTTILTLKATSMAQSMKSLIDSIASGVEEKLLLEDSITEMVNDAAALVSYLDYIHPADKKRRLLKAYKRFLEAMIIDVDNLFYSKTANKW